MTASCIYVIESISKPERFYIGSAVDFTRRMSIHTSGLRRNKHHSRTLQRHYNKYGMSDLRFEILELVPHREDLLTVEQTYLDVFQPFYNTSPTAGSRLGSKSGPLSEAHKKRLSECNKGKIVTEHFMDTHRVKIQKYSIYGEYIKTYRSGVDAGIAEGCVVKPTSIKNITAGGFVWVRFGDPLPDFEAIRKQLVDCRRVLCKQVLQIDRSGIVVNEFDGVRIACKKTGIDHRSISQVASGSKIRKTAGGFIWKYKEVA